MRVSIFLRLCMIGAVGVIVSSGGNLEAASARSVSYSLDYSEVGAAAGSARSADSRYSMTGLVTMDGIVQNRSQGGAYSIEPLNDAPGGVRASVKYWMLYR